MLMRELFRQKHAFNLSTIIRIMIVNVRKNLHEHKIADKLRT